MMLFLESTESLEHVFKYTQLTNDPTDITPSTTFTRNPISFLFLSKICEAFSNALVPLIPSRTET